MLEEMEVLTPVAACELFGKSAEAVRRAVAEGFVKSPGELRFGVRPIRLIDLQSALDYWSGGRRRAAYMGPLDDALANMRLNSISIRGYARNMADGTLTDDPLSHFRILHCEALLNVTVLGGSANDLHFE